MMTFSFHRKNKVVSALKPTILTWLDRERSACKRKNDSECEVPLVAVVADSLFSCALFVGVTALTYQAPR